MKESPVREKAYQFAIKIIGLCRLLRKRKEYVLSDQLCRSGASIGANVEEASAGQSRKDFIAKMAVASKEARETNYWLRLLRDSNICTEGEVNQLLQESTDLVNILTSIVKTSQLNSSKL